MTVRTLRRALPFVLVGVTVLLGVLGYFEVVRVLLEQLGYALR
ncbi:hypothetical protein [Natronococcus pandeyae]|nr:hypothetical protein [Natronococcus pandeyae]